MGAEIRVELSKKSWIQSKTHCLKDLDTGAEFRTRALDAGELAPEPGHKLICAYLQVSSMKSGPHYLAQARMLTLGGPVDHLGIPKTFRKMQESEVLRDAQLSGENIYQEYRCILPASEFSGGLMEWETSIKWAVLAWHILQILLYIYAYYKTYGKARHNLNNLKDGAQNVQGNVHRGVVCWTERFSVP